MPVACWAARTIASAITSAARAPMTVTSASPARVPVARAKTVSPSTGVWAGEIARARPSWAICATFVACALVRAAFVATTPIVVFCPAPAAAFGGGPHLRIAHPEVEQDGRGHDRHLRHVDVEADALLLQPADGPGGGFEAERASPREDDRVDFLDRVHRIEQVGLPGAGRASSHVDPGHGAGFGQDHGAAGGPRGEGVVADLETGHGGEAIFRGGLGQPDGRKGEGEEGGATDPGHGGSPREAKNEPSGNRMTRQPALSGGPP